MAYPEAFADRVREALAPRDGITEKPMFGARAWMLHGNMACAATDEGLLVRLAPDDVERALLEPHVGRMEMGGRTMGGFVLVAEEGVASDEALQGWVDAGAERAGELPPKA